MPFPVLDPYPSLVFGLLRDRGFGCMLFRGGSLRNLVAIK